MRLGADYKPLPLATHFQFPDDGGSLAKATVRCLGLGECRKQGGGAMCPSYRVTLEEEHSTRGRAHMLFELLQGEVMRDAWKDEHTKRALDLCLSCKACKSECPTNVDIATYRAEFLSHYYESKARPLHAHAFGKIDRWARLASFAPGVVNFVNRAPVSSHLLRAALHLAPQREIPRFAPWNTFQRWALLREGTFPRPGESGAAGTKPGVILWADTFNNHFHPETSRAALTVLQRAGFAVSVPQGHLCCGRPLLRLRHDRHG